MTAQCEHDLRRILRRKQGGLYMAKITKKLNRNAKKFNKKVTKWEKKNPGATFGIKIGAVVASGIATKIVVKQEVKKQLEAAKAENNPAPEKKSFFSKIPFIGKKKKDVPTPEPEKVEDKTEVAA